MKLAATLLLFLLPSSMQPRSYVVVTTAPPTFCTCTSTASAWSPWRTYKHEWPELEKRWEIEK